MEAKSLQYIIRFLLGDDIPLEIVSTIGYTSDRTQFHRYNLVIIPSGFFNSSCYGHEQSLPALPLQEIEGIPLLFGEAKTEKTGATLVVKADIIASTYFLVTRYEEMVRRHIRDEHGRFTGKESLPYRAKFIDRPIVDEYRVLLRRWLQETNLNIPPIKQTIQRIWLTHDVDAPFLYRSWKGFIRSLIAGRGIGKSFAGKWGPYENDPFYTFPWIFQQDKRLQEALEKKQCKSVYFIKGGGKDKLDKPHYNINSKDIQHIISEIDNQQAAIGLHVSYEAGKSPGLIKKERQHLEKTCRRKITYSRHHFLACREPEDMHYLEAVGIKHDFTLGYADVAGFRLGTAWPVQWINPATRRLSPLILHPLLMMDCTIEEKKYMGLSLEEGKAYCLRLIERVKQTGGELSFLWHNSVFMEEEICQYQRTLYSFLMDQLIRK